jgi:STE24 endopeptidase
MSRLLLLIPFLLWTTYQPKAAWERLDMSPALLFLAGFALLIGTMGLWSRLAARRISNANLRFSFRRFNQVMDFARWSVPVWFGIGIYLFRWSEFAHELAGPLASDLVQLPMTLIGVSPALITWGALWWAQYPAERALREQSMVFQLDNGIPPHQPPALRQYLLSQLRMQLLFILIPLILILAARDVIAVALSQMPLSPGQRELTAGGLFLVVIGLVILVVPEILRRILHTEPLPPGPLRERLEMLCKKANLRYRDILLWRTGNTVGNAAVMGLIPRMRYVLLSDVLLESMSDRQIEAVFAHELGHIVHRHMTWFVVFFITLASAGYVLETLLMSWLPPQMQRDLVMLAIGLAAFILCFGYLSRRFEHQADVFAARTMEMFHGPAPVTLAMLKPDASYVGPYGAGVFVSALQRVAAVNNIQPKARNWTHGSIDRRMQALQELATNPSLTTRFDRFMHRLYVALLCLMCMFGAWALTSLMDNPF